MYFILCMTYFPWSVLDCSFGLGSAYESLWFLEVAASVQSFQMHSWIVVDWPIISNVFFDLFICLFRTRFFLKNLVDIHSIRTPRNSGFLSSISVQVYSSGFEPWWAASMSATFRDCLADCYEGLTLHSHVIAFDILLFLVWDLSIFSTTSLERLVPNLMRLHSESDIFECLVHYLLCIVLTITLSTCLTRSSDWIIDTVIVSMDCITVPKRNPEMCEPISGPPLGL